MRLGVLYGFWPPKHESEVILNFYRVVGQSCVFLADFRQSTYTRVEFPRHPLEIAQKYPQIRV